jgi:hypothetical protein
MSAARVGGGLVVVDQTPEELDPSFVDGSAPTEEDVQVAQRALLVHVVEHWPHGDFCRNCKAPFPCRLARWGYRVLKLANWSDQAIAELYAEFRRTGTPPWKARPGEVPAKRRV